MSLREAKLDVMRQVVVTPDPAKRTHGARNQWARFKQEFLKDLRLKAHNPFAVSIETGTTL